MTTLVVIPQFGGAAELIAPFTDLLGHNIDVRVIEPPGFGDSPSPRGIPSTRALARAVVLEMDRLELDRVDVFGISLGGMIAEWVAIDAPERVERLILASTTARGLDSSLYHELAFARCMVRTGDDMSACLADEVLVNADAATRARVDEISRDKARSRYDILWLAAAAAAHDARDSLAAVRARTLVLTGSEDSLVPPSVQAELLDYLGNAELETLPGVAHDLTIEAHAACAARVLAFLQRD